MRKVFYVVGAAATLSAGIFVSIPLALAAGACVLVLPLAVNRPQHLILASRRRGALLDGMALRVLTYNIFMRPSLWFVKNNNDDYKNERLDLFIEEHLASFGIICLQEMFGTLSWRQRKLLSAAEERGFQHAAVGGSAPFVVADHHFSIKIPFLDSGVVTLSKYPIKETDTHHYTSSVLIDSFAPKIVLWTLVKLPQFYLHVFNTHMQSTHTGWSTEQTAMARARQMEELAFFVRQKMNAHPHATALICGDFNLDARGQYLEYVRMLETMQQELSDITMERGWQVRNLCPDFPVTYGQTGEHTLTLEKDWDSEMCLDYVLFVGPPHALHTAQVTDFRTEDAPFEVLSDHQGIECDLLF